MTRKKTRALPPWAGRPGVKPQQASAAPHNSSQPLQVSNGSVGKSIAKINLVTSKSTPTKDAKSLNSVRALPTKSLSVRSTPVPVVEKREKRGKVLRRLSVVRITRRPLSAHGMALVSDAMNIRLVHLPPPRPTAVRAPLVERRVAILDEEHGWVRQKTSLEERLLKSHSGPCPDSMTVLGFDARMLKHRIPNKETHVERPERLLFIWNRLVGKGLVRRCAHIPSRAITDDEITDAHDKAHLQALIAIDGQHGAVDSDTYYNPHTVNAARLSAGTSIDVCMAVAQGKYRNGFCVVRPPGHHAEHDKSMGFCHLSNVALAIRAVQRTVKSVNRVLVVDWDVHHGNGTQDVFWEDKSVLFFSAHGYGDGFYPGTGHFSEVGAGTGAGYTINLPWPCLGVGDHEYLDGWDRLLLPVAKEFQPDLVVVSAGFDSAEGDYLGNMKLTPAGYSHLLKKLMGLAFGRVVVVLEGGYNTMSIARSAEAVLKTLLTGEVTSTELGDQDLGTSIRCGSRVDQVINAIRPYWPKAFPAPPVQPVAPPSSSLFGWVMTRVEPEGEDANSATPMDVEGDE